MPAYIPLAEAIARALLNWAHAAECWDPRSAVNAD